MALIGIVGLIGSGKDTIASRLVDNWNYEKTSWATPLKDITASLFGWDREMVEGTTAESREVREIPDPWWSEKFGYDWSPRIALQYLGTNVLREHLHQDIWVLASLRRIEGKENIVISDTRYLNEIDAVRKMGGQVWRVKRGPNPDWYEQLTERKTAHMLGYNRKLSQIDIDNWMFENYPSIHSSEYAWHGSTFDCVIENNGSIADLHTQIDSIIRNNTVSSAGHNR